MKAKHWGLILLLLIIAVVAGYTIYTGQQPQAVSVTGFIGGEKIGFVDDPEVTRILKDRYKITLDYQKAGSLDMVGLPHTGRDYLWPSSQTALELYKKAYGKPKQQEIIFNTPIVLYTRRLVADALIQQGYVSTQNGVHFLDMQAFLPVLENDTKWSELGVGELYGSVLVATTNPTKSNSGNMFSGLLANMLNGAQVVSEASLPQVLPRLKSIFQRLGYMQTSSADIFGQFLKQGVDAFPIVAGYESQLIEFAHTNPRDYEQLKDDIVLIYPVPTVWSSHIYIALSDNGRRVIPAFLDEQLQKIAWEKHGFRTGVNAANIDTSGLKVQGVAPIISKIIQMPDAASMEKIIQALAP